MIWQFDFRYGILYQLEQICCFMFQAKFHHLLET